jgi:hypothetical protein
MDERSIAVTSWFDEAEVIDPLGAFAELPDWLAAAMLPDRVAESLRRHVPELAQGEKTLLACVPQRLRAKGDEWLARYRLDVAGADEAIEELVVVGRLWPPSADIAAAEPAEPGARFGDVGWGCLLPDLRLELHAEQEDPALPALQQIVDPAAVRELIQEVLHRAGHADAVITSCDPQVVRYKPGSRCTVVVAVTYEHNGGELPSPLVLKTHQGDKGQTAWAAMTALWRSPVAGQGAVRLAEPLAYLAEQRILVQGPIPEDRTLKVLAREAITEGSAEALDELRDELAKTARALAALHQSGAEYGRTATFDDELAEVREVIGRLSTSVPTLEKAGEPLLQRLEQLAAETPAEPSVPAHHDFRPAQVLLHQGSIGFIDFDGAAMAEPALDLGRFRAKLRDIGISVLAAGDESLSGPPLEHNLRLLDELCEHFLLAYQEHAPVSRQRVLLWEACDLLTAMLHAWTKVRLLRVQPRLTVLLHQLRAVCRDDAVPRS